MKHPRHTPAPPPSHKRPLRDYRYILPALFGWLVFVSVFFLLKHLIPPIFMIGCAWDDRIPFLKGFFVAYCSWYLYLLVPSFYLALRSKREFILQQTYVFLGLAFCLLTYVVFPNGIDFRPEVTGSDPLSLAIAAIFAIDAPSMVFPSMHVFCAAAIHVSLARHWRGSGNRLPTVLSFLLAALIIVSTVFVRQHSVLDVAGGLLLAAVLYFPVYGRRRARRR